MNNLSLAGSDIGELSFYKKGAMMCKETLPAVIIAHLIKHWTVNSILID